MTDTPAVAGGDTARSDRVFAGLLLALVLLGLTIRVNGLHQTAPAIPPLPQVSDAAAYRLLASNLADGDGYVRPFDLEFDGRVVPTAEYPPGYPVFLAVFDRMGLDSETEQRTLGCIVGSITVGLVGLIARRLGGRTAGLIAAGLAALHPSLWSTDTSPLAEPLAACLGAVAVLAGLWVHDGPDRWRRWALLGGITAVGGLVRSELLLVGPAIMVPLAWRTGIDTRRRLRLVAAGAVAMVAVLMPWTLRNYRTFHQFVPVSNNLGSVLRGANCDGAYRGQFKGLWVTNVGGDTADPSGACFTGFDLSGGRNEAGAASILRRDGLAYIRDHLDEVPGVMAARVGRTTGLYQFEMQTNFAVLEGRVPAWDRWGTRLFQVLSVIAVAGAVVPWRRRGPRWMAAVPVAAVLATVMVTYGNVRFRAVADPMVVVLAAVAVADVLVARPWSRAQTARPAEAG